MTEAQFRKQVEADAIALGWSPALAATLAKLVGKPTREPEPRGPVGKAPAALDDTRAIRELLRVCGLPAAMQNDLKAAGIATFEPARRLVAPVVTSPSPKAAAAALGLHLLGKRIRQ